MGYGVQCHFQQYFSYIVAVSCIGGGNWSTRRKQPTCCKWLTFIIRKTLSFLFLFVTFIFVLGLSTVIFWNKFTLNCLLLRSMIFTNTLILYFFLSICLPFYYFLPVITTILFLTMFFNNHLLRSILFQVAFYGTSPQCEYFLEQIGAPPMKGYHPLDYLCKS